MNGRRISPPPILCSEEFTAHSPAFGNTTPVRPTYPLPPPLMTAPKAVVFSSLVPSSDGAECVSR